MIANLNIPDKFVECHLKTGKTRFFVEMKKSVKILDKGTLNFYYGLRLSH